MTIYPLKNLKMYNYDPEALMDWLWSFGKNYDDNEEEGQALYKRILDGDIRTVFSWPEYLDIAIVRISVN